MVKQLTQKQIEDWDMLVEYTRRSYGKQVADQFKNNFVNYMIQGGNPLDMQRVKTFLSMDKKRDIYESTDNLMNLGAKISPGDDIYIDCRPTNTFGEEINPGENIKTMDTTNTIFDELSDSLDKKNILENIGFQIMIGILLFSIIYYIGNYIFVKYPKNLLEK